MDARLHVESLLATSAAIDLEVAAAHVVFTVPAGKTCVITKVVMRSATGACDSVKIRCQFTAAGDVIALTGVLTLTITNNCIIFSPISNALMGVAAATFEVEVETVEDSAAEAIFDVFGYLF